MGTYRSIGKQILHVQEDIKPIETHIADAGDNEKAHFLATAANAYSDFDYMTEADKTCSIVFGTEKVDRDGFVALLADIAGQCEALNLYKKLLFRGKTPDQVGMPMPRLHESLAVEFDPNNTAQTDIDLLHGIVGVITEAGEMAEVLLRRIETGEFDRVNAIEETGDVMWYLARQLRGMNTDIETMQRINIDKLHGRHGESFDVFRDANRDLTAERKQLETQAAPLFDERTHDTPKYGECVGDIPHMPPEPGLVWHDGCWRREIVRDIPGLAV